MSYQHVADETIEAPKLLTRDCDVDPHEATHSIWRCPHCRALAVEPSFGPPPSGPCGKCHR